LGGKNPAARQASPMCVNTEDLATSNETRDSYGCQPLGSSLSADQTDARSPVTSTSQRHDYALQHRRQRLGIATP